jgi:acetylornithine deacetylase/succinyl-diaminopimelate desuccinylase-like protein
MASDAAAITRDLIRFDTTNTGDARSKGERLASEYVIGRLQDWGYEPSYFEAEPGRGSIVLRIPGTDPARPGLVLHGHLDVVPADPAEWQADPFAGEIRDGMIWGRGAVDMKDMAGMMLAVVGSWKRRAVNPPRDIILTFFADEEAGGRLGSIWMTQHHPELFRGATQAVSEVGGFSVSLAGQRAYLIQTAEKGIAWLRLTARGTPGHGSAINTDNAAAHLVAALSRIAAYNWPVNLSPAVRQLLLGVAELTGLKPDLDDPEAITQLIEALGPASRFVGASVSSWANVTSVRVGDKVNVISSTAEATVDLRPLPGDAEAAIQRIKDLAGPHVSLEPIHLDTALEAPFDVPLVAAMRAALRQADPGAPVLPYMLAGGTDGKGLSRLGIDSYGFVPLRLPTDFDFTAMFHGVDERIPVDAIGWGAGVLDSFLLRS